MADILEAYSVLSASSTRADVSAVLLSIVNASPFEIDAPTQSQLIRLILDDLRAAGNGSNSKLSSKDAAQALLAVKNLGKNLSSSEYLSSPGNLSTLLALFTAFKDDSDASSEALRCIANALLLVEDARSTFIQEGVDGGTICVSLLEKSATPDQIFILSRILFLCTASGPPFIRSLVEQKHYGRTVVEIIAGKLDSLTVAILSGTKMAREAMSDLLKFTFNLLLHYPKMVDCEPQNAESQNEHGSKVLGDFWSSKLDGLLPPLLRTFSTLPPTFPSPVSAPLTHVIHALITIPIFSSLRPIWFGANTSTQSPRLSGNNSKISATPTQPAESSPSSGSDSPTQVPFPASPKPSTLDRALSVIVAGRRSLTRSPSPNTTTSFNVIQRACDLLEVSFCHYFPGDIDPDEQEVRERCRHEAGDNTLDDLLSPLLVLISRLCIADDGSKARVRQFLVPDDLDRSTPLEARSDLLGRCLRLLGSVYHPRLKDAVGEMLFAMSDSNASTLSALVGYGNVAGFLFHKGILNAPPNDGASSNASLVTPSGAPINPITGTIESNSALPAMSDEEKEREMEKLFVLFDRLERTGAIPPNQNPMRRAVQEATFGK